MSLSAAPGLRRRLWLASAWLGALMLLLALALIAPYLKEDTELVRLRNALVLADDLPADFDWRPPAVPSGFLLESAPVTARFAALAQQLQLAALPNDWERAVAISKHLLGSQPVLWGGALRADLDGTYDGIVQRGGGYCGDFVRAFNAIAVAAGMTTRSWAFSFDGFGGHGHIWPEIWNRQAQRWQLLDVFDNYYFVDGSDEPLSAMAFRAALLRHDPQLKLRPIDPRSRIGYVIEAKAWDYYRRGASQWFLVWGTNPFSYDGQPMVRAIAGKARALEQLAAIAVGVHPPIRILPEPGNAAERRHLHALRVTLWASALSAAVGLLLLVAGVLRARATRAMAAGLSHAR